MKIFETLNKIFKFTSILGLVGHYIIYYIIIKFFSFKFITVSRVKKLIEKNFIFAFCNNLKTKANR